MFDGCPGQVAEWLKAPVSKTGIPVNPVSRVRISPCPFDVLTERRRAVAPVSAVVRGVVDGVMLGTGGRVV